jgi:5-methyltetrahydrofolate--homocysteine methyltransferase
MSALLTTTMTKMPAVIKALAEAGLRDQAKVMIGGAPVTQEYSRQIGADGYAPDASQAVALARALLNLS